jgi:hypothetical protein
VVRLIFAKSGFGNELNFQEKNRHIKEAAGQAIWPAFLGRPALEPGEGGRWEPDAGLKAWGVVLDFLRIQGALKAVFDKLGISASLGPRRQYSEFLDSFKKFP